MSRHLHHPIWIVALRKGLASVLACSFIALWPDYDLLYGTQTLVDHELLKHFYPPTQVTVSVPISTLPARIGYLILCVFLFSGLYQQASATLLLALHGFIFLNHPYFSYGFDYLASTLLLYCVVLARWPQQTPPLPYLRCLQLHTCVIYFFAGASKAAGPTWRNGEALWKALQQPGFDNPFRTWLDGLSTIPTIWMAAGWAVLVLEIGYPLFIWLRHTRQLWLCSIITLHIGIAALLGLYAFSALMVLINLVTFYLPYRPSVSRTKQISIHPMVKPLCRRLYGSKTPVGTGSSDTKQPTMHE